MNTLPNKNSNFWQLELLPFITILRMGETEYDDFGVPGGYWSISIGWLFWSWNIDFQI